MQQLKPMIILDRDGVINYDSPDYIKSPNEWLAIPGSLEAIAHLNKAGHLVTIATNQSGIGRGFYDVATLEKIHQKMLDELAEVGGYIDRIYFCPHMPTDHCTCRKPKPGMLLTIAKDFNIDLKDAVFIGDSSRDMEAAKAANCSSIFIGDELSAQTFSQDIPVFSSLFEAVKNLSTES